MHQNLIRPHRLAQATVAAFVACADVSASAQQAGPQQPAQAAAEVDIAAQPLGTALSALARQSGARVVFSTGLTEGKTAPAVRGRLTVAQALQALLAGSGLAAQPTGQGGYTVVAAPAAGGGALAEVRVTAQAERNDGTTEGTGSYTATGPSSTATGLGLTLRETPQSVTVVSRQRMDDFRLETLTDVLEQTPGVTVSRQNDMVTFNVRGSAVNLQVDGNRQYPSGWGWNTHILYALDDLAEIDRVEVLKGSSGLINGDGSYGATVNLVRKRPTREFQASARAGAGSWSTWRADADIGGPLNDDGSLRGRIVAARKDGESFNGQKNDNTLLYGTLEYDLAPGTVLSGGATWRQRELRGAAGTTPIQAYSGTGAFAGWMPRDFNIGAPWAGYRQESLNLFARLEHHFANGWTAKVQLAHEGIDTPEMLIGSMRYALPAVAAQYGTYRDIDDRNESISIDLQGPFSLFGREHQLLVGAGASRNRTTLLRGSAGTQTLAGTSYADGPGVIPRSLVDGQSYSNDLFSRKRRYLYTAGRFNIADPVRLIVGARATDFDQNDATDISWYNYQYRERGVVTPYAGLTVDVSRDVSLYASYASIFQAQGAKDINERTLPPEEGNTYEIGAKGEFFDRRLNASAAYFWMKTDNAAEEVGLTPGGETIYRAVSGATRRGWELELSGELARGWQAQGSYVLNDSSLGTASTLPKHQFKLGSTYRFGGGALQGLTVGASTRWQGEISTSRAGATLRQDAYWLLDLMARYQLDRHWSVAANVNNALDKKYFSGVTNFSAQGLFYTWGAPRSVTLSARYDF